MDDEMIRRYIKYQYAPEIPYEPVMRHNMSALIDLWYLYPAEMRVAIGRPPAAIKDLVERRYLEYVGRPDH